MRLSLNITSLGIEYVPGFANPIYYPGLFYPVTVVLMKDVKYVEIIIRRNTRRE